MGDHGLFDHLNLGSLCQTFRTHIRICNTNSERIKEAGLVKHSQCQVHGSCYSWLVSEAGWPDFTITNAYFLFAA